jgi:hypothetical protein
MLGPVETFIATNDRKDERHKLDLVSSLLPFSQLEEALAPRRGPGREPKCCFTPNSARLHKDSVLLNMPSASATASPLVAVRAPPAPQAFSYVRAYFLRLDWLGISRFEALITALSPH